jgi:hypothetical protein
MSRDKFKEVAWEDEDQDLDNGPRRIAKKQVAEPRRSPIRRKDKLRTEADDGFKSKAKRSHRKLQNKIKYDWQGE